MWLKFKYLTVLAADMIGWVSILTSIVLCSSYPVLIAFIPFGVFSIWCSKSLNLSLRQEKRDRWLNYESAN